MCVSLKSVSPLLTIMDKKKLIDKKKGEEKTTLDLMGHNNVFSDVGNYLCLRSGCPLKRPNSIKSFYTHTYEE